MADSRWDGKSEEDLWKLYRRTKDQKLRDFFVRQYAPLVKYVAGKIALGMPQNVEFDDLVGFGVFGLFDAIDKFDPGKHVKFKTYAVTRIRGAIFDELRTIDWVPRSVRQKAREVEETVRRLESSLGRAASDEEIASGMEMDLKDFQQMMLKISGTSMLSLHDIWYTGEDNDKISIAESIESPGSLNPDTIVEKEEIKRVIVDAIKELPDKEKKVLVLYYYEDLTLKEIGEVLAVTESRVSQLHTKAVMRLRAKLTSFKRGLVAGKSMAGTINLEQLQEYMRRQAEEDAKNRTITLEAETLPEGLKRASIELGTPLRNLEYEVLQKGSGGTMGVGRRPWKLHVYEKSRQVKTDAESAAEERRRAEEAAREPERPHDLPGEVFVRIGSEGAFLKVTKPQGRGPRPSDVMAFEKLSLRGVSNYDTALVSRVVKHADGEYIRVADIRYDPSRDSTASIDITDGEMKAVMVVTEPGPGGADISVEYVRSFLESKGVTHGMKDEVLREFESSPGTGGRWLWRKGQRRVTGQMPTSFTISRGSGTRSS